MLYSELSAVRGALVVGLDGLGLGFALGVGLGLGLGLGLGSVLGLGLGLGLLGLGFGLGLGLGCHRPGCIASPLAPPLPTYLRRRRDAARGGEVGSYRRLAARRRLEVDLRG